MRDILAVVIACTATLSMVFGLLQWWTENVQSDVHWFVTFLFFGAACTVLPGILWWIYISLFGDD